MSRAGAFDAFYREAQPRLLHQVYAATGSVEGAREAVADGFVAAAHHWRKVELETDRDAWVRQRALHAARRNRVTGQPSYDARTSDTSRRLFEALRERSADDRHLLVVHLVARQELTAAAREAGMTDEEARRSLAGTEAAVTGAGIDLAARPLVTRLDDLRADLYDVPTDPPRGLRKEGNRRRRSHVALAGAAALALAIGAGALTAAKPEASAVIESLPGTPSITTPSEPAPETFEQPDFSAEQLATLDDVASLDRDARWRMTDTSADFGSTRPVHACVTVIPTDPRASHVWVRSFSTAGKKQQTTAAQLLEVSRNADRATRSYDRLVTELATCPRGGYEVRGFARVRGIGNEATLVRLAKADRKRIVEDQVLVSRTGRAVSAWTVQAAKKRPVPDGRLRAAGYASVNDICGYADGRCAARPFTTVERIPPTERRSAGFLAAVDMPLFVGLPDPWVATGPERTRRNPAATDCDRADFRGAGATRLRTRSFVLPTAEQLADIFGMTQVVGEFRSPGDARAFVREVRRSVATCNDRQLSLEVDSRDDFRVRRGSADVWEVSVGTSDERALTFRVALVRMGSTVSQLTFTPTRNYDLTDAEYVDLARRLVARLTQG